MGNATAKGYWPPVGTVTVVLAGGRTEQYHRPVVAGDIMLRHPRHHVVRPDFFRSSLVVVLKPEEVLKPGRKFLLVPFHTVQKRLRRRVELLHRSCSNSPAAASPNNGDDCPGSGSRVYQLGAITDINCSSHRSVCTKSCVEHGKKELADRRASMIATRSPAGRHTVSRKSSPTTTLQARKTLLQKEKVHSRNSRRKKRMDYDDQSRRKTSLLSHLQSKQSSDESSPDFTETAAFEQSPDAEKLQFFESGDFMDCNSFESSVDLVPRQAGLLDLSVPEYESFQSSAKSTIVESFLTSVKEQKWLIMSTVTSGNGSEAFEAMDSFEQEKSSSEPLLPLRPPSTPSPRCGASVNGRTQERMDSRRGDSGLDHGARREADLNRFKKPPGPTNSPEWESMLQELTCKAPASAQAISYTGRPNGLGQQPPSGKKQQEKLTFKAPAPPQQAISYTGRPNGSGQQPPSGEKQLEKLNFKVPAPAQAISYGGGSTDLGQQSHPGEKQQEKSSRLYSLPKSARLSSNGCAAVDGMGPKGVDSPKRPRQADLNGSASVEGMMQKGEDSHCHYRLDHRKLEGARLECAPLSEFIFKTGAARALPDATYSGGNNALGQQQQQQHKSGERQLVSYQEADRNLTPTTKSKTQQQQKDEDEEDQVSCLRELQMFYTRPGNNKMVVKALNKGLVLTSSADPPQVDPKQVVIVKQQCVAPLVKKQRSYRNKLIDHLCLGPQQGLDSPLEAVAAAGNTEEKLRRVQGTKLIDHLNCDHSPPQNISRQPAATSVNLQQQRCRTMPMPQSGNAGSTMEPKARKEPGKELVTFQLRQVMKNQWDPSTLPSNNVNQMLVTSMEEKSVRLQPASFFRRHRIRTRRRIYRVANWKPKLSPLIEFSPTHSELSVK